MSATIPASAARAMNTINPYQAPTVAACPALEAVSRSTARGCCFRLLTYALTGVVLAAAFCTPLSFAREVFYDKTLGPIWPALAAVIVSTTITGGLLDFLIRSTWHCLFVGLAWAMMNAVVFALLLLLIPAVADSPLNAERIAYCIVGAIIFGSYGGVLCLHLALPISALGIWCERLGDRGLAGINITYSHR